MLTFWLNALWLSLGMLESELTALRIAERGGSATALLPQERVVFVGEILKGLELSLHEMKGGFLNSILLLHRLAPRMSVDGQQWEVVRMIEALQGLKDQIMFDRNLHRWARIDVEFVPYFVSPNPWGNPVFETFPNAHGDIRDTGHAIACELYTAAVFHAMRVAEHGLRFLARTLRVTLIDKGKRQPVDHATWDKVINAARNRIAAARTMPAGPQKRARLGKFARAADHCDYMKDIWRNDIAHTQKAYSKDEASAVLGRVREFMQFLASI
jgi:hypothetical protein